MTPFLHVAPPLKPKRPADLVRDLIEEHEPKAPPGSVCGQEQRRLHVLLTTLLADILVLEKENT